MKLLIIKCLINEYVQLLVFEVLLNDHSFFIAVIFFILVFVVAVSNNNIFNDKFYLVDRAFVAIAVK